MIGAVLFYGWGRGRKGTRVYDFGWVPAAKGWGNGAMSVMRLQMHATDPDQLERRLGTAQSKGCIRIPASLNEFISGRGRSAVAVRVY